MAEKPATASTAMTRPQSTSSIDTRPQTASSFGTRLRSISYIGLLAGAEIFSITAIHASALALASQESHSASAVALQAIAQSTDSTSLSAQGILSAAIELREVAAQHTSTVSLAAQNIHSGSVTAQDAPEISGNIVSPFSLSSTSSTSGQVTLAAIEFNIASGDTLAASSVVSGAIEAAPENEIVGSIVSSQSLSANDSYFAEAVSPQVLVSIQNLQSLTDTSSHQASVQALAMSSSHTDNLSLTGTSTHSAIAEVDTQEVANHKWSAADAVIDGNNRVVSVPDSVGSADLLPIAAQEPLWIANYQSSGVAAIYHNGREILEATFSAPSDQPLTRIIAFQSVDSTAIISNHSSGDEVGTVLERAGGFWRMVSGSTLDTSAANLTAPTIMVAHFGGTVEDSYLWANGGDPIAQGDAGATIGEEGVRVAGRYNDGGGTTEMYSFRVAHLIGPLDLDKIDQLGQEFATELSAAGFSWSSVLPQNTITSDLVSSQAMNSALSHSGTLELRAVTGTAVSADTLTGTVTHQAELEIQAPNALEASHASSDQLTASDIHQAIVEHYLAVAAFTSTLTLNQASSLTGLIESYSLEAGHISSENLTATDTVSVVATPNELTGQIFSLLSLSSSESIAATITLRAVSAGISSAESLTQSNTHTANLETQVAGGDPDLGQFGFTHHWSARTATVTGTDVTAMPDQIGSANVAATGTPQLIASELDGEPAVSFNGTNQYFEYDGSHSILGTTAYTAIYIIRTNSEASGSSALSVAYFGADPGANQGFLSFTQAPGYDGGFPLQYFSGDLSSYGVAVVRRLTNSTAQGWVGGGAALGTESSRGTGNIPSVDDGAVRIGYRVGPQGQIQNVFDGWLVDFAIAPAALTAQQIDDAVAELQTVYPSLPWSPIQGI